jgi:hypothetical protein
MTLKKTVSFTPGTPHPYITAKRDHEIVSYDPNRVTRYSGYQMFSVGKGNYDAIKINSHIDHCNISPGHLTFKVNHTTGKMLLTPGGGGDVDLQINEKTKTFLDESNNMSLDKSDSRRFVKDESTTRQFSINIENPVNLDLRDECTIILAPNRSPHISRYHQRYLINSIVIRSDGHGKLTFYKPDTCGDLDHPVGELNIPLPNDTSPEEARAANNSGKLFAGLDN